jgi:hypothetical protein
MVKPNCLPSSRPAGVHWVPADQFNRVVAELQTNPCAAERFPFETMESLRNPTKHAAFVRAHLQQPARAVADCACAGRK